MSEDLAAFLDDLNLHIEREISKVPAPVAQALLRDDSPLSTVELLRILARPEQAADLVGARARPEKHSERGDSTDLGVA